MRALLAAASRSCVRDHAQHLGQVGIRDHGRGGKVPLGLGCLRGKDVPHEGLAALHSTASGLLKALGRTFVRLQFRHRVSNRKKQFYGYDQYT